VSGRVSPLTVDCSALTAGLVELIVGQFINVTSAAVNAEQSTVNGETILSISP